MASAQWLTRHQRVGVAVRDKHLLQVVIKTSGALQSLYMPAISEGHLIPGHNSDHHQRHRLVEHHHLAIIHRQKTGTDILRVTGATAKLPCTGNLVTALHFIAGAVGEELATHGHAVVVGGEHCLKPCIG